MKIYISGCKEDREYIEKISQALKNEAHEVFDLFSSISIFGKSIHKQVLDAIKESDVFIFLISKNSICTEYTSKEWFLILLGNTSNRKSNIIPVLIDQAKIPKYLYGYNCIYLHKSLERGIRKILSFLSNYSHIQEAEKIKVTREDNSKFISELSQALKNGKLTLVSGAGTSIAAGMPSWNNLLTRLTKHMAERLSKEQKNPSLENLNHFIEESKLSPLIRVKYIKYILDNDFTKKIRNELYISNPKTCDIIEAIVDLARPRRESKSLDSIITFNFDSLVEENLEKNNIKYKAIYMEGMRSSPLELPIYHVHGYLPRKGRITKNNKIVFSEDTYHNLFIDPFSWSNLILLNKLSQNTCLFLGLSMTDPNLRRLLDIANRRNPSNSLNHFIIKDKPQRINKKEEDRLPLFLIERDFNELGLNTIWIEDFKEIPDILTRIGND